MEVKINETVLSEYGFKPAEVVLKSFGTGHINSTFLLTQNNTGEQFILQSININVFKKPDVIAQNVKLVADFLAEHYPEYLFVKAIPTIKGEEMAVVEGVYGFILDYFNSFKNSTEFPDRAMHHDTKISNMLFDKDSMKGICVIDLDTLMAGKFISDLGDMMRTYLCAYSENEPDISKITIRIEYFEAIVNGYLHEMGAILSKVEKELILFSAKYLIYMQAIRFLTDYLNGNIYYPIAYAEQNLDRTKNQFKLLNELYENEKILIDIVNKCLKEHKYQS